MKGCPPAWRARFYPEEADRIDLGVIEDEVALAAEQRAAAFYQRLTDMWTTARRATWPGNVGRKRRNTLSRSRRK